MLRTLEIRSLVPARPVPSTLLLLSLLLLPAAAAPAAGPEVLSARLEMHSLNVAMNEPDRFAWEVFAAVNRSAGNGSRDVIWETWASTNYLYDDPCRRPEWPGTAHRPKELKKSALLRLLNHQAAGQVSGFDAADTEETRLNRAAFGYVVDKELWYQEGVVTAAARDGIDFPRESIVVKANWTPITEEDKARYYWQEYKGQLLGLNAFHLVNKALPSWFWSTFEHVDNAGRCDYIGCKDRFGVAPAYLAPHREPGKSYAPGRLTPELVGLFQEAGLDLVWKNYRLKGTQVQYTDDEGRPVLLGNSVLEPGFSSSASCMTCHGRASTSDNDVAFSTLAIVKGLMPVEGFVGAPDPAWFGNQAGAPLRQAPLAYRTDFLWELGTQARSNAQCGDDGFTVCDGSYALCAAAPCRPIPAVEGGGFDPQESLCECVVEKGPNIGSGSCSSRSAGVEEGLLISTYSFALAESDSTMTCPQGDYTNCFGAPCVVDPKDPSKASCRCPIVSNDGRPFVTQGGGCDLSTCASTLWSGATPDVDVFVNATLASDLGLDRTPVEHCPVQGNTAAAGAARSTGAR